MLKQLLSRLLREPPPGELATDDWAPVPVHAMAQPADTIDWLREGDGMPRRPVVAFTPVEPVLDELLPDHLSCFSPEELAVIREQQAQPVKTQPMKPQPVARGVGEPRSRAERSAPNVKAQPVKVAPPKAARKVEPDVKADAPREQSWVEVLKRCGEHLTDAELQIIRQQLASS